MDTGRNKVLTSGDCLSPGRVTVDARGRNVWQWDGDQVDSTTIMLSRLDNSALALEPTRNVRRPDLTTAQPASQRKSRQRPADDSVKLTLEDTQYAKYGGGFDPYNRS